MPSALSPTWVTLWLPVVAYMAMLFGLSSFSKLPSPPGEISNYHVHAAAYAGLAVLAVRALAKGRWQGVTWPVVCGAITIASVYGVTDEYHQLFVPGREFDVMDIASDAIGSVAGAGAVWAWGIISRRSETRNVL